MIERIGYFHFVDNPADPLGRLKATLAGRADLRDSLIVLPEAFNNGRSYYDTPRGQPTLAATETLDALRAISRQRGVVFVVGLLDPPNNSAFIVDDDSTRLICHKKSDDWSGNYTRWTGGDAENPAEDRGASIGVLICNEVQEYTEQIAERCDKSGALRKVICIPARMDSEWFGSGPLSRSCWFRKYVVLANSDPFGCGSFVADMKGSRMIHRGESNHLVLKTWAEIDSVSPSTETEP